MRLALFSVAVVSLMAITGVHAQEANSDVLGKVEWRKEMADGVELRMYRAEIALPTQPHIPGHASRQVTNNVFKFDVCHRYTWALCRRSDYVLPLLSMNTFGMLENPELHGKLTMLDAEVSKSHILVVYQSSHVDIAQIWEIDKQRLLIRDSSGLKRQPNRREGRTFSAKITGDLATLDARVDFIDVSGTVLRSIVLARGSTNDFIWKPK